MYSLHYQSHLHTEVNGSNATFDHVTMHEPLAMLKISPLLTLPTELIIYVLSYLPIADILACQRLNRLFDCVVRQSVLLRYAIETKVAGVVDNPHAPLVLSERLENLRSREDAWASFTIKFRSLIPVPHVPSGIYDLTGGIYLLGNALVFDRLFTTAMSFLQLPSSPHVSPAWTRICVNHDIVDIGLAEQEHNLIGVLV